MLAEARREAPEKGKPRVVCHPWRRCRSIREPDNGLRPSPADALARLSAPPCSMANSLDEQFLAERHSSSSPRGQVASANIYRKGKSNLARLVYHFSWAFWFQ